MGKKNGRVTINDIAAMSGVSKATVSRYINGKFSYMGEDTRKRIEAAIKFSNYLPSAAARSLKTQHSYLVGVAIADITSPFSGAMIMGIGGVLEENGYIPVFVDSGDSDERERQNIRSLLGHQVDGLLVNTTNSRNSNLIAIANSGFPVVLCDRGVSDFRFDIAKGDYYTPTLALIQHLRDEGYGQVFLCTQPFERNEVRTERVEAFIEGYRDLFGVTRPEDNVLLVDVRKADDVRQVVREVVEGTPEGEVPAIIGVNSVTLMSLLYAISRCGLSMPDDIGLCGPDDWGWSKQVDWDWSETFGGGITTFKVHPDLIGAAAARLLLSRIEDLGREKETILVPTKTMTRASTSLRSRRAGNALNVGI